MPETEAEKVVVRIMPLLEGKTVIDLGCGRRPITRWAVGVDDSSETKHLWPGTVIAKIDPDSHQLDAIGQFDVVFSSHALEHIRAPIGETLRYWFRLVKPGGRLVIRI
jgi:SAM-dependent methyltransferase